MTPEQAKAKEYAEILLAFSRGEKCEFRNEHTDGWLPLTNPEWNFGGHESSEYRIAPKPVEAWAVLSGDTFITTYRQRANATIHANESREYRVVLMREVTE